MKVFSVVGRRASVLCALVGALAAIAVLAPSAGAVLVHVGHGQVAGVTPVRGVSPASIPGSFARRTSNTAEPAGTLDYHGGVVMHGASPYLIFWDPAGSISAADKALYTRYVADGATDSGNQTNVYSVDQQFTDGTGFARYHQVFAPSHAINDTQAYPPSGCTENNGFTETNCLTDAQLQVEISRLIAADGLPTGDSGDAPEYFLITPPKVNSCFDSSGAQCADNVYCAYHSSFPDGPNNVIYSNMPTLLAANDPKGCQYDQSAFDNPPGIVQAPNGAATKIADVTLKAFSHEFNESITDPNLDAWYSNASGQENGDECNFYNPTPDPAHDGNPNAFAPTLGGSEAAGTLFNQIINGNHYYIQSEWSNGGLDCEMQPTAKALTATFTAPSAVGPGTTVTFDPSASSSAAGYSSSTWSTSDGASSFNLGAPAAFSHKFTTAGTYTVTLTVVDTFGNLSTVSHTVLAATPTASFTASTTSAPAGTAVGFDGSGSSEPGGSIASYAWSFGDGSSGTGPTTSHAYATAATYTVTLTVTDPAGQTATTSQQVKVSGVPKAEMAIISGHAVAGVPFGFDGHQSSDTGSTLVSYAWSFGDGTTATGVAPKHTFKKTGKFSVTLTVTDASGSTASVTEPIVVKRPSISNVRVKKGAKVEQLTVKLSGPGTLRLGSKKVKVGRPRTVTLKVKLTKSQLKALKNKHKLTVRYKLRFTPVAGAKSSKSVTIKLKS